MSIENLSSQQVRQFQQSNKSEESHQAAYATDMDKMFLTHNQMMTRILQNGLSIPKQLLEKIKRNASELKKIYFGLDNYMIDPTLLPKDQGDFVVFTTESIPVVLPLIFFEDEMDKDKLLTKKIIINQINETDWFETEADSVEKSDFLKTGLVFFGQRNFIKKEKIKMIHITQNPFLPEHTVIFSMKCNFFSLLLFFYTHQQYFSSLQAGLTAYLQFVNKS
ncbi:MAG: hypothetical protein A2Y40_10700 [Candidatus Margulisbacteria bacterium GWF2_35_9]|nr:MAG: hypothetical protein A2Y40_10700 [Candidatus Margulisbacteria bacterium GWF2_35_9]